MWPAVPTTTDFMPGDRNTRRGLSPLLLESRSLGTDASRLNRRGRPRPVALATESPNASGSRTPATVSSHIHPRRLCGETALSNATSSSYGRVPEAGLENMVSSLQL